MDLRESDTYKKIEIAERRKANLNSLETIELFDKIERKEKLLGTGAHGKVFQVLMK